MMKKFFYLCSLLYAGNIAAQVPEDAIRMSWNAPSGTARSQAIGGAIGSLGGEITSLYANPAGLAFFKTSEFVISPGLTMYTGKSNFLGSDAKASGQNNFNLGTTGFVFGYNNPNSKWSNKAFSFAVNRTANFNGRNYYKGENDYSSFSEAYVEEFSQSGLPIDVFPLYSAPLSLGTKLANYTYLIDTLTVNGRTEIAGMPQRNAILNNTDARLMQEKDVRTTGGITELAFGFASNMDDKIYFGGSLGIPIIKYNRTTIFNESDLSGDNNNNFNFANYREDYSQSGVGINARLGMIFKPTEQLRGGLAIQTPTIYGLKEKTTGSMSVDLENYLDIPGVVNANSDTIYTQNGQYIPEYRYDMYSPWKFMVSGSYIINGVEDVSQQKGFISADVEYITYGSTRFVSVDANDNNDYYKGVNDAVKFAYKGAFNFRVGGEMKFNTFMARLGFAYYGKPYDDNQLKGNRMNFSGGLGYRNKGIFLDLTYVQSINKDIDFPYRLSDKDNIYAGLKNNIGNVLLTLGFKF